MNLRNLTKWYTPIGLILIARAAASAQLRRRSQMSLITQCVHIADARRDIVAATVDSRPETEIHLECLNITYRSSENGTLIALH
jgi:hypothetical protein